MRAAAVRIELRIPWSRSLKEKRSVLRRFVKELGDLGSLSIAEVDDHDRWQTATVGVAMVAPDKHGLEILLDRVRGYLGRPGDIDVVSFHVDEMEVE